jgi:FKBP-type peptidyl-prolyl cis-trans isomerase (trigger factor)
MKPDVPKLLEILSARFMFDVAPNVQPSYRQSSVSITGILLTMVREETERAAARRVEENAVLRALFAKAAGQVADTALRRKLEEAAASRDPSLLLSELESANAALRALLIELHVHVEEQSAAWARALDAEIWRELAASTERRRLSLAPF